ncbi:mitochondrial genome maintenance MGM101-domain-containing protein [Bisporella sp. PMI_857]|nr:mitochondrial genome maintenance MGM101-domain-containing protein [Bisporella sp. PMI_857]
MAASLPRVARSGFSECSSVHFSILLRSRVADANRSSPCLSKSFSVATRLAAAEASTTATPAKAAPTPYVRKAAVAKTAPVPAKPISKSSSIDDQSPIQDMTDGLADEPLMLDEGSRQVDWTRSFHGLSSQPFSKEAADILMASIPFDDVEVKPDGIIYLPEIKYRRILNRAFGPGAWGLAPRGETIVTQKSITREYALVAHGRLVSVARGEQDYFSPEGIPTATEGCKSNALMRCCKDLGVASELWDPRYIRKFMKEYARQIWVEHILTKKKKQIWLRKDDEVRYPFKETKFGA